MFDWSSLSHSSWTLRSATGDRDGERGCGCGQAARVAAALTTVRMADLDGGPAEAGDAVQAGELLLLLLPLGLSLPELETYASAASDVDVTPPAAGNSQTLLSGPSVLCRKELRSCARRWAHK